MDHEIKYLPIVVCVQKTSDPDMNHKRSFKANSSSVEKKVTSVENDETKSWMWRWPPQMSDPNILSPLSLHLSSAPPSPLFPSIPPSAFIPNSPSGPPSCCSASGLIRTRVSRVFWCSCTTGNLFRGNGWAHFGCHRQETHRMRHRYRWSLFSFELWLMRELAREFLNLPWLLSTFFPSSQTFLWPFNLGFLKVFQFFLIELFHSFSLHSLYLTAC